MSVYSHLERSTQLGLSYQTLPAATRERYASCPLCSKAFTLEERVHQLACGHLFCMPCLKEHEPITRCPLGGDRCEIQSSSNPLREPLFIEDNQEEPSASESCKDRCIQTTLKTIALLSVLGLFGVIIYAGVAQLSHE